MQTYTVCIIPDMYTYIYIHIYDIYICIIYVYNIYIYIYFIIIFIYIYSGHGIPSDRSWWPCCTSHWTLAGRRHRRHLSCPSQRQAVDPKGHRCLPNAQETISREVACDIYMTCQLFCWSPCSFLLILEFGRVGVRIECILHSSTVHQSRVISSYGSRKIRVFLLPSLNNFTSRVCYANGDTNILKDIAQKKLQHQW